jgi:hypothetical protein
MSELARDCVHQSTHCRLHRHREQARPTFGFHSSGEGMRDYKWLHEYCLNRFGSAAELEAHLPVPKTRRNCAKSATTATSTMALRVFRAGLKHSLVDAKWPAFEEVFFKFDPEKSC